jgi:hypothetical protein
MSESTKRMDVMLQSVSMMFQALWLMNEDARSSWMLVRSETYYSWSMNAQRRFKTLQEEYISSTKLY